MSYKNYEALFDDNQTKCEKITLYKLICDKCKTVEYSKEHECRYDFLKRLKDKGWTLDIDYIDSYRVLCDNCKRPNIR